MAATGQILCSVIIDTGYLQWQVERDLVYGKTVLRETDREDIYGRRWRLVLLFMVKQC